MANQDQTAVIKVQYDTAEAVANVDKLTTSIANNKARQQELKEALKQGKISQQDYATQIAQTTATINSETAERKKYITVIQSEVGAINRARAENIVLRQERDKLGKATGNNSAKIAEYNKKIDANTAFIKSNTDAQTKQMMNVGNYKSALEGLPGPLGQAANGITNMVKTMWAFVANPIGAVIAALVLGVTALYKAFVSTDSGATEMAANMETARAVMDIFRQKAISFIETIKNWTKGIWDNVSAWMEHHKTLTKVISTIASIAFPIVAVVKGIGNMTSALKSANPEFEQAAKAAREYIYALDRIEDAENNYVSKHSENANKIARLEFLSQDKSKPLAVRRDALKTALAMSEDEAKQEKKFLDERLDNELTYLAAKSYGVNKVTKDEIKAFLLMSDEEQANAKAGLKFIRNNNEAKFKDLEQLYAKSIDADTKFFEQNKRNMSRLTGFDEQVQKDREENAKKAADKKKKDLEDRINNELNVIKFNHDMGITNDQQYYDQLAIFRDKYFKQGSEQWMQYTLEIKKAEDERLKQEQKTNEEIEKARGEAIWKLAELKGKELELATKTEEDKRDQQIKNADAAYLHEIEKKGITDEEIEVAEQDHKMRLQEIETAYQEAIAEQRQAMLDRSLSDMQTIIDATAGMMDQRVSIIAEGFAQILTINFKEVKSAKDAFIQIGQAAQGLTSLITAGNQAQLEDLKAKKDAELAAAGDNAIKKAQIERKYNKQAAELKRRQAIEDKAKAIIDIAFATTIAVARAIKESPKTLGLPWSAIIAGLGIAETAYIASRPIPNFTSDKVFAKGGIIGGAPHSQGGTKFWGTDGSMFEAERGEAMFVLKKDATAKIAALSMINESYGGRSWTGKGGSNLADGGEVTPASIEKSVNDAMQRTPIIVKVGDIATGLTELSKVKEAGTI